MVTALKDINLIQLVGVPMKRKSGQEYAGPCPFCHDGTDRFIVQLTPRNSDVPLYWCRVCGKGGNAINFVEEMYHVDGKDARNMLGLDDDRRPERHTPRPPQVNAGDQNEAAWMTAEWQSGALALAHRASKMLDDEWGKCAASNYLQGRGIDRDTARYHGLGMVRQDLHLSWGSTQIWVPRGITIPWDHAWGELSNIRVRRPAADIGQDGDKYMSMKGCGNALYIARSLISGSPVIMTEGEFDAIIVEMVTRGLDPAPAVVSIGSCTGARQMINLAYLAQASLVLLAFDADEAGDNAANWWSMALKKTRRLRPVGGKDASEMHTSQRGVLQWVIGAM